MKKRVLLLAVVLIFAFLAISLVSYSVFYSDSGAFNQKGNKQGVNKTGDSGSSGGGSSSGIGEETPLEETPEILSGAQETTSSASTSDSSSDSNDVDYRGLLQISLASGSDTIGGGSFVLEHNNKSTRFLSLEGEDNFDGAWTAVPTNPNSIWLRPSSSPYGTLLAGDVRPDNSTSEVNVTFSVVHTLGGSQSLTFTPSFYLVLFSEYGTAFGDKTITIQQYNPSSPGTSYPLYNVRDQISAYGGLITLAETSGDFTSGDPFAYFRIRFS